MQYICYAESKMIYETAVIESTNVMHHLWIYRPQITVDHVAQSLQQTDGITELRVLEEFLKKVMTQFYYIFNCTF